MEKYDFNLRKGIGAHIIKTDKFKTNLVCLVLAVPLKEETVTQNAIIPFILGRGSNNYNNQIKLNEKLEELYGADYDCSIDKIGDYHILKFYIETIDNKFAFNGENVLKDSMDLLLEIVLNPYLEDGWFKEEYVEFEKENLGRIIDSKIDNKDAYALSRCVQSMYGNTGFGLYKYGDRKHLDSINNKSITEYYRELVNNSKMDLYISGNVNIDEVKDYLNNSDSLNKLEDRVDFTKDNSNIKLKEEKEIANEVIEKLDVAQGKLIIGLDILYKDLEEVNSKKNQAIAMVYNSILGDGSSSLLFQNVREKAGLAYSAKSSFIRIKSNIFIRCGIEIGNYEYTVELIKKQLELIRNGEILEENIRNSKTYIVSNIKNIKEEQDLEMLHYINQEISNRYIDYDEYIKLIEEVTIEDIIELSKKIQINTIYFLRNEEN